MNIDEEINNITKYINNIEANIQFENKLLLSHNELIKIKSSLQEQISNNNKKIININNEINSFVNKKRKILDNEDKIYLNELKRIKEKKIQIKDLNNVRLKECIKNGIKLYVNKNILINDIKLTNFKINEFNNRKIELRKQHINHIKNKNAIIKKNKNKSNELQILKNDIKNISDEINKYSNKKNKILECELSNSEILKQLELLDIEQNKLIKKKKQMDKHAKFFDNSLSLNAKNFNNINLSKPTIEKLPANYKKYKKTLELLKLELDECNRNIKNHIYNLEKIEYETSDEYITNYLNNHKNRCILRKDKMYERVNSIINDYKKSFESNINDINDNNKLLNQQLNTINIKLNNINMNDIKESKIQKNDKLLSTIKNRLNYLKLKKNT